jgi:hypothetical protein
VEHQLATASWLSNRSSGGWRTIMLTRASWKANATSPCSRKMKGRTTREQSGRASLGRRREIAPLRRSCSSGVLSVSSRGLERAASRDQRVRVRRPMEGGPDSATLRSAPSTSPLDPPRVLGGFALGGSGEHELAAASPPSRRHAVSVTSEQHALLRREGQVRPSLELMPGVLPCRLCLSCFPTCSSVHPLQLDARCTSTSHALMMYAW